MAVVREYFMRDPFLAPPPRRGRLNIMTGGRAGSWSLDPRCEERPLAGGGPPRGNNQALADRSRGDQAESR